MFILSTILEGATAGQMLGSAIAAILGLSGEEAGACVAVGTIAGAGVGAVAGATAEESEQPQEY